MRYGRAAPPCVLHKFPISVVGRRLSVAKTNTVRVIGSARSDAVSSGRVCASARECTSIRERCDVYFATGCCTDGRSAVTYAKTRNKIPSYLRDGPLRAGACLHNVGLACHTAVKITLFFSHTQKPHLVSITVFLLKMLLRENVQCH